jgi:hypothetical protein
MKNAYFNVGFRNDQYKCTMNIEKKETNGTWFIEYWVVTQILNQHAIYLLN